MSGALAAKSAVLAIEAYLECSLRQSEHPGWVVERVDRLERAMVLASSMNNKSAQQDCLSQAEKIIDEAVSQADKDLFQRLVLALLRQNYPKPANLAKLCEDFAWKLVALDDLVEAATFFGLTADCFGRTGDIKMAYGPRLSQAEVFVTLGERQAGLGEFVQACSHLSRAIEIHRQLAPRKQDRIDSIHETLLRWQRRTREEMSKFVTPFDVSEQQRHIRQAFSGLELPEAIRRFCLMANLPTIEQLEEFRKANNAAAPFLALVMRDILDEEGRLVGHIPSLLSESEADVRLAIEAQQFDTAIRLYQILVVGTIEPARLQITLDHQIREDDLLSIVLHNPFIPDQHELYYLRGLLAGFRGDWDTCAHLLIPQVECSVRHLLRRHGFTTSYIERDMTQKESDLNRLLRKPELLPILGPDLILHLRCILVERTGLNLRNKLAHGFLPFGAFFSWHWPLIWWLVLKVCAWPVVTRNLNVLEDSPQSTGATRQEVH